jgi:biotin synthase
MMDLLYEAASIHREHHDPNVVQVSTLLSIKQVVARKIAVIAQAARYHTSVEGNDLMSVSQVKPKLCEQNQVGLPEYVWEQPGETKDGPEFDQVLRWFVPSTNWRWKCALVV